MPVTSDIAATWRGPRRVFRRLLGAAREDRALAVLMGGCLIVFVAQWPRLAREAHLEGTELNMKLGAALLAWLFIAPLIFYALALVSHALARLAGGRGTALGARLALFWAFLAASPLILLHGLVAGFIGPGPGLAAVGMLWCAVFAWFWIAGLIEAEWSAT